MEKLINKEVITKILKRNFPQDTTFDFICCKWKDTDDEDGVIGEHIDCKVMLTKDGIQSNCLVRTDVYEHELNKLTEVIFK